MDTRITVLVTGVFASLIFSAGCYVGTGLECDEVLLRLQANGYVAAASSLGPGCGR